MHPSQSVWLPMQAASAHALHILACHDAAQAAMAQAHALPALLAALHGTSDTAALDAIVRALGNRVCSDGNYAVGGPGARMHARCFV